jgi:hypothetical protein
VVNCSGGFLVRDFLERDPDQWLDTCEQDVRVVAELLKAALASVVPQDEIGVADTSIADDHSPPVLASCGMEAAVALVRRLPGNGLTSLVEAWNALRQVSSHLTPSPPLITEGIRKRVSDVIAHHGITDIGGLLELDPLALVAHRNIGMTTITQLLELGVASIEAPDRPGGPPGHATTFSPDEFGSLVRAWKHIANELSDSEQHVLLPTTRISARAAGFLAAERITTLGTLMSLAPEALSLRPNFGTRSLADLLAAAREGLAYHRMRTSLLQCTQGTTAVPLREWPLSDPVREFLQSTLEVHTTEQLRAGSSGSIPRARADLAPEAFVEYRRFLRAVSAGPEALTAWLDRPDPHTALDFVDAVETSVDMMPSRNRDVVLNRLARHMTLEETGRLMGITRERVRQIQRKFTDGVGQVIKPLEDQLSHVLDDGVVEFHELVVCAYEPEHPREFYVGLARLCLGDADNHTVYLREADMLSLELSGMSEWVLGELTRESLRQHARRLTPALLELPGTQMEELVVPRLGAVITPAGRIVPSSFPLPRVVRAIVQRTGAPMALDELQFRVTRTAGSYGLATMPDLARLRYVIRNMADLHLLDLHTVSPHSIDASLVSAWRDTFIQWLGSSDRPRSAITFLDEHPDAPFDKEGMATILADDRRVERVGRRLYCLAGARPESTIRVKDLVREALESEDRPWTIPELVEYIRNRRDLRFPLLDAYLDAVPGIVRYDRHAVGFRPLDRDVMLDLLRNEAYLGSRIASLGRDHSATADDLWLLDHDEHPTPTGAEAADIIKDAASWMDVEARWSGTLVFRLKE